MQAQTTLDTAKEEALDHLRAELEAAACHQYVVVLDRNDHETTSEDIIDVWADGVKNDDGTLTFYRIVETTIKRRWVGVLVQEIPARKYEIVAQFKNFLYFTELGDSLYGGIDPRMV